MVLRLKSITLPSGVYKQLSRHGTSHAGQNVHALLAGYVCNVGRAAGEFFFKRKNEESGKSPAFILNLPVSPASMTAVAMKGCVLLLLAGVSGSKSHLIFSPGYPLGLFSDYSNHEFEFPVKIREKGQNWLEVLTSDGALYMSIVGRDKKVMYDNQGSAVLNIRNKALNLGGEYHVSHLLCIPSAVATFLTSCAQVFEGDGDKLSLFTIRNKWSFGGHKMSASFTNFDDKSVELQIRGKLLNSNGKIVMNDQPIARFEGGIMEPLARKPGKSESISRMTIAPLGTSVSSALCC